MNTGVLEMSNVDLSSEFTDMITDTERFPGKQPYHYSIRYTS